MGAEEDGGFVSAVGGACVAREPETSVTEEGAVSVAREGAPAFLEPEASVARVDGASVTREGKSCSSSGPLMGSDKTHKARY